MELVGLGARVALVYIYDYTPLNGNHSIEIHELMRDPAHVAVTRTHPLAGRTRVELHELAGERWLTEGEGALCRRLVEGACRQAGFQPKLQLAGSDDYRVVQALVAAEIGIALIPHLAQQPDPRLAFIPPAQPIGRTIAAACRAGGRRSPAVATMIDFLAEAASAQGETAAPR